MGYCSKRGFALAMSLGACGLIFSGCAHNKAEPAVELSPEEMMEQWMALGQPSEHHQALNAMAGDFSAEIWFMMDPNGSKTESTGEAHSEWILDGRYLATRFSMDFMGMPFEGHGILGHDNIEGHYISGWIDNMSTGLFSEKGELSDDGRTLTMHGSMTGPGNVKMTTKHIYRIESNDKHTMEFWEAPVGEELVNTGAISYTRMGS